MVSSSSRLIRSRCVGQYAAHEIFWNHRLQQANVYSRFFRANGIFYDPNILGRYLVLALLIVLAYAYVTDRGRDLLILGAVAIVLGAGLFVTFSRSSALGLMVGVALLALRAYGWRRTLIVGGAVLIVLGGAAVLKSGNVRHALTSSHRLERISEGRFDLASGENFNRHYADLFDTDLDALGDRLDAIGVAAEKAHADSLRTAGNVIALPKAQK